MSPMQRLSLLASLGLLIGVASGVAQADFRQTTETATIGYDGPSAKAGKLFLYSRGTPLEVISEIAGWAKLRDAQGGLVWVERKALGERTQVQIKTPTTDIHSGADANSPTLFRADNGVLLTVTAPPLGSWLPVRLPNGQNGYVRLDAVFGY